MTETIDKRRRRRPGMVRL